MTSSLCINNGRISWTFFLFFNQYDFADVDRLDDLVNKLSWIFLRPNRFYQVTTDTVQSIMLM